MTRTEKSKSGQVALFLVFLLAGLVLLFSLNVELFKSARTKLRLQNIADASAMTVARWQGMTLNMIGDLNFAHIKALGEKPRVLKCLFLECFACGAEYVDDLVFNHFFHHYSC